MASKGRYVKYFTKRSQLRKPSPIRALQPLLSRPGVISLGGGMPNSATFPITDISLKVRDGTSIQVPEVEKALQYSNTNGLPSLLAVLETLQSKYHGEVAKQSAEQSILMTTGSQDALTKTFELLLEEDDSLLLEEFTYSGSLAFLKQWGCNLVPIRTDNGGIIPSELASTLESWDEAKQGKKPKVLYTIPTGSNPTGISVEQDRRKALYAVAKTHDLLILEDDPYYFLQFQDKWLPSLYSMDEDARVVRFDSFSKILSSGLRLGFMTGPKEVVDQVVLHMQATSLHTSGVSQGIANALFHHWGETHGDALLGFQAHVDGVIDFYRSQRQKFLKALETHLTGLCRWRVPDAGMFFWIEVLGVQGAAHVAQELIEKEGVLVVAGVNFQPAGKDCPYIRVSFSTASEEQMNEALARFARLLSSSKQASSN